MALVSRINCRGWIAVCGGFLVHITLGTIYSFGNMTPYFTSYLRAYSKSQNVVYTDTVWLFGITAAFQGLAMFLGGVLNARLGTRITTLIGGLVLSAGTALTAVTVKDSLVTSVLTYGVMVGLGTGVGYAPPLACAMKWLPNHKGLVNGIVVAGFGGGAFIFDQVQTAFINPDNLSPDKPITPGSSEKYYSKENAEELLARVPKCFLLLGGCYAALQLIGCLMIVDPPQAIPEEEKPVLSEVELEKNDINTDVQIVHHEMSMHPTAVVRTREFYTLWFTFLFNGLCVLFISTFYKTYGQTFITDDHFLALLGAFASVGNSLGRIMWGKLVDRFTYKTCMLTVACMMAALMATLMATPHGGKPMFFIWIVLIFLTFSGSFALLPTATARVFGPRYVAINYGLVFTSQAVTGLFGSLLTTNLSAILGWTGMFFLVAGFSVASMILTFTFNGKDAQGNDI